MKKPLRSILPAAAVIVLLAATMILVGLYYPRGSWKVPPPGSRIHIPVLALHRVLPGQKDSYIMPPESLDLLLSELTRRKFTSISLAQLEKALVKKGRLPQRPVVLTFDDGFLDGYVHALPVLKRHNFKAAFFVPAGYIADSPAEHIRWGDGITPHAVTNADPADLVCMNWSDLAALSDAGMDIGSHAVSHLNLTKVDDEALKRELTHSRTTLEKRLGISVVALTYPGGRRDGRVCEAAKAAGYSMAFRSHGSAIELYPTNLMDLKRIAVPGYCDATQVVFSLPECEWR